MHLFINASAASAGGGLTYLRNVIPHLSDRQDLRTTLLAARGCFRDLGELPGVQLIAAEEFGGTAANRFWREQTRLPRLIRRCGCNVLLSTGNVALFPSPVPQILLARNALYTSSDFYADAWARRDWRLWLNTRLQGLFAKWSVMAADRVVAPSVAFAHEVSAWLGNRALSISVIPHGFDQERFFGDDRQLPEDTQRRLSQGAQCLRLLFVSHFNYFRNFDTLLRALPMIKSRLAGRTVQLVLTCTLGAAPARGRYSPAETGRLARQLEVADNILELDLVPHSLVHRVYRACDIYVTPSYAESFAHPLVEAMACGLPLIASDLPVHREVCGDAALYFPRFSPELLAGRVGEIACSAALAREMAARALARSRDFSWKRHVDQLISLAGRLANGSDVRNTSGHPAGPSSFVRTATGNSK